MNREVLHALTALQNGRQSIFVPMETIVEEVFAMKNDECLDLDTVKFSVRKSLTSLTRNGLLEKSGNLYSRCEILPETSDGVYNTRSQTKLAKTKESLSSTDTPQKSTPIQVMCTCCRRAIDTFYKTYQRLQTETRIQMLHAANPIDNAARNVDPTLAKGCSSEPFLSTFDTPFLHN